MYASTINTVQIPLKQRMGKRRCTQLPRPWQVEWLFPKDPQKYFREIYNIKKTKKNLRMSEPCIKKGKVHSQTSEY